MYPSIKEYKEAILFAEDNFEQIKNLRPVLDEDGNPVQGVAMQFCSDTACMLGETDETGTVVFNEKMGHYTVHILEAPEEYAVDNAEFTLEEFCDLTIILFRS